MVQAGQIGSPHELGKDVFEAAWSPSVSKERRMFLKIRTAQALNMQWTFVLPKTLANHGTATLNAHAGTPSIEGQHPSSVEREVIHHKSHGRVVDEQYRLKHRTLEPHADKVFHAIQNPL
jgi:hypothetical protein